jgi:hypothetical protein
LSWETPKALNHSARRCAATPGGCQTKWQTLKGFYQPGNENDAILSELLEPDWNHNPA